MSTIRYFIPEDGDEEIRPNVFLAPKSRSQGRIPSLLQIKDSFPIPGKYYFRFKSPLYPGADREKAAMAVWMDLNDDDAPVPTWRGNIIVKATRIGIEDDEDEDESEFFSHEPPQATVAPPISAGIRPRTASPAPSTSSNPVDAATVRPTPSSQSSGGLLDVFDSNPSTTITGDIHGAHSHHTVSDTANLLGSAHHEPSAASPPVSSLFDMDGPIYNGNHNNVHSDFLGMTAPAAVTRPSAQHIGAPTGMPTAGSYNSTQGAGSQAYRTNPHQQAAIPLVRSPQGQVLPPQGQMRSPPGQIIPPQGQMRHPQGPGRPPQGAGGNMNAFNAFKEQQSPFGGLGTPWK